MTSRRWESAAVRVEQLARIDSFLLAADASLSLAIGHAGTWFEDLRHEIVEVKRALDAAQRRLDDRIKKERP